LESAIDELAAELGMDPLEVRRRNHADRHPTTGEPFAAKRLLDCYDEGARRVGWDRRPREPRQLRDGDELVGLGMATAVMPTMRFPASARVRLDRSGLVTVEVGTQEIGTGTTTVLARVAARRLGCGVDDVTVRVGDTTLPRAGMTAGSSTTLSVGSAVDAAASLLLERLRGLAGEAAGHAVAPAEALRRCGPDEVEATATWTPPEGSPTPYSFGAVFAEVGVDELLCVARVRRIVGVYSVGTVLSPVTARSQMLGGMVWGLGQALLEESVLDDHHGRFVAKNLTGYLVPCHADVPSDLDVFFIDDHDDRTGGIGGRGIGELGAVGVAAAIVNAVHHASGVRVHQLPVRPEDLLGAGR
jgi:xanthine dehydrogenase YagR molybdenum-binding subunit